MKNLILISHRGNVNEKNISYENNPNYISTALQLEFNVEIDLWRINSKLYLGHDSPQYIIDENYILNEKFWIHIKNSEAMEYCSNIDNINYFWHNTDDYTLTSFGFIWTYPNKKILSKSIAMIPNKINDINHLLNCSGICNDYICNVQMKLNNL